MHRLIVLAIVLAALTGPADAQTAADAHAFLRQSIAGGAVKHHTLADRGNGESGPFTSSYVYEEPCVALFWGESLAHRVDFRTVTDVSHFYDDAGNPGLRVMASVRTITRGYEKTNPGILIVPGSIEMEERIARAIGVIRDACAPDTFGF